MSDEVGNKAEHGRRSSVLEKIIKSDHRKPHRDQQRAGLHIHTVKRHREPDRKVPEQKDTPKEMKFVYKGFCKDIRFNGFSEVREAMDIFMESEGASIFVEVQTQSSKICLKNDAGEEVKMTITGRVIVVE